MFELFVLCALLATVGTLVDDGNSYRGYLDHRDLGVSRMYLYRTG